MNDTRKIDELLAKFYAADSTQEEIDTLFKYFLHTQPLPEKYADDELLIRSLAMERYCYAQRVDIHKKLLAMENQKNNLEMRDSINSFLKVYNQTKGYDLIISNTAFDNLLYGNPAYNITNEIVEGLNARYAPSSVKK